MANLHKFTDTPCGRALAARERDLDRPLSLGEMSDFLLDNFMEIANSDEAHLIRDAVLLVEKPQSKAARIRSLVDDSGYSRADAKRLVEGGF